MKHLLIITLLFCIALSMKTQAQVKTTVMNEPPSWAKEAIWYQIFVERFNNGDTLNDPTEETIFASSDFFKTPKGWCITPWNKNWYEQEEWAKLTGGKFDQTLQLRRYG